MNGMEMIAAERQRQREMEGYDEQHDDSHTKQEMWNAAKCYITSATLMERGHKPIEAHAILSGCWPWEKSSFKISDDPVRNLVKGGALMMAERSRLIRSGESSREINLLVRRLTDHINNTASRIDKLLALEEH